MGLPNIIRKLKENLRSDQPQEFGRGLTVVFLIFVIVLMLLPNATEGGWELRLWTFLKSPPNEIGDTLAGIAGALAFLWIIVTVMLQSRELAAQREELELTRREFKKMAEAQSQQVKLLVTQGEIFSQEQKERSENRIEELVNALMTLIVNKINDLSDEQILWRFLLTGSDGKQEKHLWFIDSRSRKGGVEQVIRNSSQDIQEFAIDIKKLLQTHSVKNQIEMMPISYLGALAGEILSLREKLSDAQKLRISDLGISRIKISIDELRELDIWSNEDTI